MRNGDVELMSNGRLPAGEVPIPSFQGSPGRNAQRAAGCSDQPHPSSHDSSLWACSAELFPRRRPKEQATIPSPVALNYEQQGIWRYLG